MRQFSHFTVCQTYSLKTVWLALLAAYRGPEVERAEGHRRSSLCLIYVWHVLSLVSLLLIASALLKMTTPKIRWCSALN